MVRPSTLFVVAVTALVLAIVALVAIAVGFPLIFLGDSTTKTYVQGGNYTFDLYHGSVRDTLNAKYRLYQGPSYYLLELDAPSRALLVPNGVVSSSANVQVRIRNFSPAIIMLGGPGSWEYIYPLSQPNVALIIPDGLCFDPPTPTCNLAGQSGANSVLTQDAFVAGIEGTKGYLFFFMQTLDNSAQDWSNYTIGLAGTLRLTLFSA